MKNLKIFALIIVFSLSIIGGTFVCLPFYQSSDCAESTALVYNSNAQEILSKPWEYSEIKLMEDIDNLKVNAVINSSDYVFSGVFDGNGHTIYNIEYTNIDIEGGVNFGIIPYANGATIKNLKIGGEIENNISQTNQINFNFADDNYGSLNLGLIVGVAKNSTVENCEIDIQNFDKTNNIELSLKNGEVCFGGIVGKAENSQFYNNLVKANLNFNLSASTQNNLGGFAGSISSCSFNRNLFFGDITITRADNLNTKVYCGGIVGFAQDAETIIKDNTSSGNFSSSFAIMGGIVGQVSSNSSISVGNINYDYWTDSNVNAIGENGEKYSNSKLNQVQSISYSFLNDVSNFNPSSSGINFKTIFSIKNSIIVLQRFQEFSFSFIPNVDPNAIMQEIHFEGLDENNFACYNDDVSIHIELKEFYKNGIKIENLVDFYNIVKVVVDGDKILDESFAQVEKTENGFIISLKANDWTSGAYSIDIEANEYKGQFAVEKDDEIVPGGLSFNNGTSIFESSENLYSINYEPFTVSASTKEQSYYIFDHWNLYYIVNGQYILQDSSNSAWWNEVGNDLATIKINFGVAPFNQSFKLEAVFSSEGGVEIDFLNFDKDKIISVSVQGNNYTSVPIKIAKTLTNAELKVIIKENFELNLTKFVQSLSSLYKESVAESDVVKKVEENADGTTTYTLNVDVAKICENQELEKINFEILANEKQNGNGDSLLWLWITIPCVVVVAIAIVLLIYFKKRKVAKNNIKKKEKEINYKDFYS